MPGWDGRYAARAARMSASEIRELLKLLDQPDIVSFAGGIPDPALFPSGRLAAAFRDILERPATAATALQYSVSEGWPPLREWLAGYMAAQGVACGPEHILITNGSQQALDFLGKLFVGPGDRVLTARPTYLGALQAFTTYEAGYGPFPGLDGTPAGAASGRLAYLMPDFANPSGRTLTLAERRQVLATAAGLDLLGVEDASYERLRFVG